MTLFSILSAVAFCFTVSETKERTASLVVLPPLILGYDELYNDSKDDQKGQNTNQAPKVDPSRTMIDVKGRRNYRTILKERKAKNGTKPLLSPAADPTNYQDR
ncbi:hypothetical protein B5X24_HaOG207949 [Helicoverpa armigera]|uniref:Uncharacterized protein n=1 Tax=Helicoverpa armigera TaxID=29058 RepID=A0A2W1BHN1_HELAM|nr:hypothetical protein B5X24_HaOG207949 [Helicoverpa armigera]